MSVATRLRLLRLRSCRRPHSVISSFSFSSSSSAASSSSSSSSSSSRSWLKYLQPDTVYPTFRSDRREVPVYIRIPDVPSGAAADNCESALFKNVNGSSLVSIGDKFDWVAFYETAHRQLQRTADLLEKSLEAACADKLASVTFAGFLRPLLQQRCRLVDILWAGHLAAVLDSSDSAVYYARMVDSLLVKLRSLLADNYLEADYLAAMEAIRSRDKDLTDSEIWLVNKEIKECRRSCFGDSTVAEAPSGMTRVAQQLSTMAELQAKFDTNVMITGSYFRLVISDTSLLEDEKMQQQQQFTLSLTPGLYEQFMRVCSDADSRKEAWNAYSARAGYMRHFSSRLDNPMVMAELRTAGDTLADQLGQANLLELELRQRRLDGAPQSTREVKELVEELRRRWQPVALDHFHRVSDFAADQQQQQQQQQRRLEPWDWDFWQRRLLNSVGWEPKMETARLRENYFELLRLAWDVHFEANADVAAAAAAELGSGIAAEAFDVTAGDTLAGRLIWLSSSSSRPLRKVTHLTAGGTNCQLAMYCQSHSSSAAAAAASEAAAAVPVVYQAWDEPITEATNSVAMGNRLASALQQLTGHPMLGMYFSRERYECRHAFLRTVLQLLANQRPALAVLAGDAAADVDLHTVAELLRGQEAMQLMQLLYRAAYEIEMWTTDANWRRAQEHLGNEFVPFFRHCQLDDEWPCSASDIFGGASRHERCIDAVQNWAVASDLVSVLTENWPTSDRELAVRFRRSFLERDSGHSFVECYRRFCGRDPVIV